MFLFFSKLFSKFRAFISLKIEQKNNKKFKESTLIPHRCCMYFEVVVDVHQLLYRAWKEYYPGILAG